MSDDALSVLESLQKIARSGECNLIDVTLNLVLRHTDTAVTDRNGTVLFIDAYSDLQFSIVNLRHIFRAAHADSLEFLCSVHSIRHEFTQENLVIGIKEFLDDGKDVPDIHTDFTGSCVNSHFLILFLITFDCLLHDSANSVPESYTTSAQVSSIILHNDKKVYTDVPHIIWCDIPALRVSFAGQFVINTEIILNIDMKKNEKQTGSGGIESVYIDMATKKTAEELKTEIVRYGVPEELITVKRKQKSYRVTVEDGQN